jgi:hypothetical protein
MRELELQLLVTQLLKILSVSDTPFNEDSGRFWKLLEASSATYSEVSLAI